MGSLNRVIIAGRLGRDPEVRIAGSTSVATLSVATSRSWFDKSSQERKEETEWHRVVLWGKQAELAGEYLNKGSEVLIEGRLKTRQWEDSSGATRYTTEIVCEDMVFLGSKGGGRRPEASDAQAPQASQGDDIPF